MVSGVNFFGPYDANDSIGRVASLNVACLESAGVPLDVHLLPRPSPRQTVDYATIDDALLASLKHKINLFHFNARRVPLYFSRLRRDSLAGFYNIGFWVHEMPSIPTQWARQLEFFDEIWTPSSICRDAIAKSANIPVIRIPYPIEFHEISRRSAAKLAGREFSDFRFLTVADIYSDAERKNPLFTVRAFLNAYAGNSSIRLILKLRNLDHDPTLARVLYKVVGEHSNIEILEGYMEPDALSDLYESADAYVSFHRAEGFGLTIADAMSRAIPVLVTGYSGNMDFCNAADTRVISYSLRRVGQERPRYRHDDIWAEPDLADAVDAMRDAVTRHDYWLSKAMMSRERIRLSFSLEHVASMMRDRLNLIENGFKFADDMSGRHIEADVGIVETYGF